MKRYNLIDALKAMLTTLIFGVLLTSAAFAYSVPNPRFTFYGDANGDQSLLGDDIPLHTDKTLGLTPNYATPQPDNSSQRWNTCDINGDLSCLGDDIPGLTDVTLGRNVGKSFTSWEVYNPASTVGGLPDTGNPANTVVAFQLAVRADNGGTWIGRPGINVQVEIMGGTTTGELAGHDCSPASTTCAIGVSISDFGEAPGYALTENGAETVDAESLSVTADGEGDLEFLAQYGGGAFGSLNIPATSVRFTASFSSEGTAPTITSTAPTTATEDVEYSYSITASEPDGDTITLAEGPNNTCGGSVSDNGDGTGTYTFTPDETQGGNTCTVGVEACDEVACDIQNSSVLVSEVNEAPYWSALPSDITISVDQTYSQTNGSGADSDLPNSYPGDPGYLSCSSAGDNCSFDVTVSGSGAGAVDCDIDFTAGSSAESCNLSVEVFDGYGAGITETLAVTVNGVVPPTITSSAPATATEDVLYTYYVTAEDTEGDSITLQRSASDTCGGALTDNGDGTGAYEFTPDETMGGTSCIVGVEACDVAGCSAQNTDITIDEVNLSPYWTEEPADISARYGENYSAVNGEAADDDLPDAGSGDPGYLECSAANDTCSFTVSISGAGSGSVGCKVDFIAANSVEDCSVDMVVSDGHGATLTETINIYVTQVWYVDNNATGLHNGTSWADAFKTVQQGIDAASAGEMVWVKEGTHTPWFSLPIAELQTGVLLYGGFDGTEAELAERGDPADHPTILDGMRSSYHVVIGASNAVIDGFIIKNGNANRNGRGHDAGGGLYSKGSSGLVVKNCLFENNYASRAGGALYGENGSIDITDSTFMGNESEFGGAISNGQPSPTMTIKSCIFDGNTATRSGGAINNPDADLVVEDSIFKNNEAPDGGAMRNEFGNISITNSLFHFNQADNNGGAIKNESSDISITNCTFNQNEAVAGGAMYNEDSSPNILNSIFWDDIGYFGTPEIHDAGTSDTSVTYSDVQYGFSGTGNINADPLFVTGPQGNYYLSQTTAGQGADSPCVDAGSNPATDVGLADKTTRTDELPDAAIVDMGFHYTP